MYKNVNKMDDMVVQQLALLLHSFRAPGLILRLGYCLCKVAVLVLPMSSRGWLIVDFTDTDI